MSKGNMLLGQARGKVGSLVFSRANGKQIVRARAEVVANPQSEKQMIQRIIMNTIAQAYSKMSAITDHSFEGIKAGQMSMSYFMAKNIALLRSRVMNELNAGSFMYEITAFSPLKTNIFACNDYVIAKGSLPSVNVYSGSDVLMAFKVKNADAGGDNNYANIIESLGLQRGDQLTFVAVVGDDRDNVSFKYARVILDPVDANGNQLPLTTKFASNNAVNSPNPRNEGNFKSLVFDDGVGEISFGFDGGTYLLASGIIVSRQKTDGSWMRSNCTLTANDNTSEPGYNLQEALDLLSSNSVQTVSDYYLNNAGTGTTVDNGTPAVQVSISSTDQTIEGLGTYNQGTSVTLTKTSVLPGQTYHWFKKPEGATDWTDTQVETQSWTFTAEVSMQVKYDVI